MKKDLATLTRRSIRFHTVGIVPASITSSVPVMADAPIRGREGHELGDSVRPVRAAQRNTAEHV